MALWLFVVFVVVVGTTVLQLTLGPLRGTPSVRFLQALAGLHYLVALVAISARFMGKA